MNMMPTQEQKCCSLEDLLKKAIDDGAPLFNQGRKQDCFDTYLTAAQVALQDENVQHHVEISNLLQQAVKTARAHQQQQQQWSDGAWVLRHCFDDVRKLDDAKKLMVVEKTKTKTTTTASASVPKNSSSSSEDNTMESLEHLLKRTIRHGAPMYNEGNIQECFDLYLETAEYAAQQGSLHNTTVGHILVKAIDEATELGDQQQEYAEAAWVLRRAFDEILSSSSSSPAVVRRGPSESRSSIRNDDDDDATTMTASSAVTTSSDYSYYWQDTMVKNTTDLEKGQCLADTAYILRASIAPRQFVRLTRTFDDCFPASQAVEVLTSLGLSGNRKMATDKCNLMWKATLLVSVSHENESGFKDGTRLYRFPDREEIQAKYDAVVAMEPLEGSEDAVIRIALQSTLEFPSLSDAEATSTTDGEPQTFGGVSTAHLQPRRHSLLSSKEQAAGEELALLAANYEKEIESKDRKYNFKTYENCFVGSDAVTALVQQDLADNRDEATANLEQLLQAGLIHHVARDHLFQDKNLFYRFTAVGDVKKSIDTIAALPTTPTGGDLVRYAALIHRYKQFAGLNVSSILNAFFGCEDESGWDLVDLENWRHNMKRWGFGRREDQDDDMVDRLAPLCVNVDPDEWDVTGDEEWESPWGILAQIAIFDQVPRSAFRGTADGFKWDDLAIRATKVAIDKGYFETAFKSTLNQFLLLLPLEHSESWEDQKLGVTLLLQLLSTVSVQDEGLTDYEIVKRLEFSKRLTTAFLEHAQVIAKFKRYPHRNRPHGRTTTLEERIWLASDLVPRWAKSQNPEDARNVIQLPVIPLKRLTRK